MRNASAHASNALRWWSWFSKGDGTKTASYPDDSSPAMILAASRPEGNGASRSS